MSTQGSVRAARARASTVVAGLALAFALGALGNGCASSTSLTTTWTDPNFTGPSVHKVMVIAVRKTPVNRRLWEDEMVKAIKQRRVTATPSYALWPEDVPDTQSVVARLRADGYDGAIVTHRLSTEERERYVPGYTTTAPTTAYQPYWGTYVTYYNQVYQPGYVENEKVVTIETQVWVKGGQHGRMVWSGLSESVDPTSAQQVSEELTGLIVPQLVKKRILP
jgi:hypothetical protein